MGDTWDVPRRGAGISFGVGLGMVGGRISCVAADPRHFRALRRECLRGGKGAVWARQVPGGRRQLPCSGRLRDFIIAAKGKRMKRAKLGEPRSLVSGRGGWSGGMPLIRRHWKLKCHRPDRRAGYARGSDDCHTR